MEQEKHTLTLHYETKVQNEHALNGELEQLREQQEKAIRSATQNLEKEIQRLHKMVQYNIYFFAGGGVLYEDETTLIEVVLMFYYFLNSME